MKRVQKLRVRNRKGSITIEASISMVLFTFLMVALMTIINVCRIQAILSNAMDISSLEIAQYSYFYQVLGGRSLVDGVNEAGQPAGDNLAGAVAGADDMLLGVESVFTLLENPTQFPETTQKAKNLIEGGAAEIGNIFDEIMDDPKQFLLSLGALGVSKGIDLVEVPLVKSICVSHIGNGQYAEDKKEDANSLLRSLGVTEGVDGLDFSYSNLYDGESKQDINIVVVYTAKLFSPFDWLEKEFIQSASTRAWLSGDEIITYADEEGKTPETPEEEKTPVSEWNIWGQENLDRGLVAKEILRRTYGGVDMVPDTSKGRIMGYDKDSNTFYGVNTIDTFSATYNPGGKFNPKKITSQFDTLNQRIDDVLKMSAMETENGTYPLDLNEPRNISNVWVIPENASQEVIQEFQNYVNEKSKELNEKYAGHNPPIKVSITIQTGFGDSHKGVK